MSEYNCSAAPRSQIHTFPGCVGHSGMNQCSEGEGQECRQAVPPAGSLQMNCWACGGRGVVIWDDSLVPDYGHVGLPLGAGSSLHIPLH